MTPSNRSTIQELRDNFDKVYIKYNTNTDNTRAATVLLVNDGVVHVGVSKFCNRDISYSKKKGRTMALGRAEHAANVFYGLESVRESKSKRREELSYSILSTDETTVDNIVNNFLNN